MANNTPQVWLAGGLRTPFVNVDGPFAQRNSLGLSVPVTQAMAAAGAGPHRFRRVGIGGAEPRLCKSRPRNLARCQA